MKLTELHAYLLTSYIWLLRKLRNPLVLCTGLNYTELLHLKIRRKNFEIGSCFMWRRTLSWHIHQSLNIRAEDTIAGCEKCVLSLTFNLLP